MGKTHKPDEITGKLREGEIAPTQSQATADA
jgi:hypothetical protein